jgi:poly(3-hydroxybutyrate) depolymerase
MMFHRTPRQFWASGLATVFALVCLGASAGQLSTDTYAGRSALIYTPAKLPAFGTRALVVVLHGGMGNAQRIGSQRSESALNMNAVAEEGGFVVAYLNGTPVTRFLGADKLGWNAGGCCGVPADKQVNDVGYIQAAVDDMAARYGIARSRIFGLGHSNGAMMTQRVMCETSLYAAAVPISGPLDTGAQSCPLARGKRLMAIHGADDQNVPISGGRGTKGLSRSDFASEAATTRVWQNSGAVYDLQIIAGADHSVDAINAQILKTESQTLAQKVARFFGLIAP